jgi:two-component system response regulator LytT
MRIAVCDDHAGSRALLSGMASAVDFVESVAAYEDAESFLQDAERGAVFDAVLMDIEFAGGISGLDCASALRERLPRAKVIFVTGFPDRYVESVFIRPANLSGFIVKPPRAEILRENLLKVLNAKTEADSKTLTITFNGAAITLDCEHIFYIESDAHKAVFHTKDGLFYCYERLDALKKRLPACFAPCHKSFLVNLAHVRRVEKGRIKLLTDAEVPVSRTYAAEVKKSFFRFAGNRI